MELLIFVVIAWVVLVPIFAVVAFVKVLNLGRRVGAREEYAEQRFRQLELRAEGIALDVEQLKRGVPRAPTPETARAPEPEPAATPVVAAQEPVAVAAPPVEPAPEPSAPGPAVEEPAEAATATAAATVAASERASRLAHAASWRGTGDGTPPPPPPFRAPAPAGPPHQSLEMLMGTRWLNWAGAVMLMIGVAFLLKYAYDNSVIGPLGRLAIGTVMGMAALVLGETTRRRAMPVVFHALTGLGLAIFYVCAFFAHLVYALVPAQTAFAAAAGVTVLAVAMAVGHNALPIAILAVLGGFISPVLLGTGEYLPHPFFAYLIVLNMVAMGAAWFRKWRALEVLCFAGTVILYFLWYQRFCTGPAMPPERLRHALGYLFLIHVIFLVVPMLNGMVRRRAETLEGLLLVLANCAFTIAFAYRMLYVPHPRMLGFIALAQSLLLFLLFQAWIRRVGTTNNTARSLLLIALGLATAAVPLHLRLYGIPIAWAMESVLLFAVGLRFRSMSTRMVGLGALLLAAGGLVYRMPMHTAVFQPVLNIPFGSWMVVAAAAAGGAWLLHRNRRLLGAAEDGLVAVVAVVGFAVATAAMSLEVEGYWNLNRADLSRRVVPMFSSLVLLWSVILLLASGVPHHRGRLGGPLRLLAFGSMVVLGVVFVMGLDRLTGWQSRTLVANWSCLPRLAAPAAVFAFAWMLARAGRRGESRATEAVAHAALLVLLTLELLRWTATLYGVGEGRRLGLGIVSALWASHAAALVWFGLLRRVSMRRHLGFALFALAIAKVLLVDTAALETVYRIVSFLATGAFLMVAGYLYNKYAAALLRDGTQDREDPR